MNMLGVQMKHSASLLVYFGTVACRCMVLWSHSFCHACGSLSVWRSGWS